MHASLRYVVSELCEFSLMTMMNNKLLYPLPKRHVREIALQLVNALRCEYGLILTVLLEVDGVFGG